MNIPQKTISHNFSMPIFGLGTWRMGGDYVKNTYHDQEDITAIRLAIESGITHIDTAEKYAEGHAEELVGKAIKGYDRSSLFLVTKVSEKHLQYNDVHNALKKSLERLQVNCVDLYMIHGPSFTVPIEETMKAMEEIQLQGFAKHIGISNFSLERLKKAQQATSVKIVAGQYHLNLKYREPEHKQILSYMQDNDMIFIAWRPLQKGLLSETASSLMDHLCQKYGKTPSQIAINWLISQSNVVTVSKMKNKKHLEENLGALNWNMEKEDIKKLSTDFPDQQNISDSVPIID
jgi:diketogulonate reductase-like aldo/keto reductase